MFSISCSIFWGRFKSLIFVHLWKCGNHIDIFTNTLYCMWYFYEKESVLFARIKNIQNLIVKIKIGFTLCKYIDVTQVDNVCSSNICYRMKSIRIIIHIHYVYIRSHSSNLYKQCIYTSYERRTRSNVEKNKAYKYY